MGRALWIRKVSESAGRRPPQAAALARFRSFSLEPLNGSNPYLAGMYLGRVPIAEREMVVVAPPGAMGRGVKVANFINFAKSS